MTSVNVWLVDKKTKKIRVSGHSGYADNGSDIVCSALSTACMLAINIIDEVCPHYNTFVDPEEAVIEVELNEDNDFGYIVMKNLYLTIDEIKRQYPDFVKIRINK